MGKPGHGRQWPAVLAAMGLMCSCTQDSKRSNHSLSALSPDQAGVYLCESAAVSPASHRNSARTAPPQRCSPLIQQADRSRSTADRPRTARDRGTHCDRRGA